MTKPTQGNWTLKKEPINTLPAIHIMSGDVYLCSVHETLERGEDKANALLFAAAKDMYEAIVIGLTGADLKGKTVPKAEAMQRLVRAKEKAEGKSNG